MEKNSEKSLQMENSEESLPVTSSGKITMKSGSDFHSFMIPQPSPSRIPLMQDSNSKDRIRRPSDCIIPRGSTRMNIYPKYLMIVVQERRTSYTSRSKSKSWFSNREHMRERRKNPGPTSEFLQLPSIPTQNAMVKTSHPVSTSGLTRLQIHEERIT
ncbi:unnamed protein product [Mytilus edulis]|uniref:Uncharacterized protein n=1 Tax=Mytilus edulis TaxID=6550 RepID=A0A8S3R046_MYTED|nr:unnamed protein product [Mytilus edulis]